MKWFKSLLAIATLFLAVNALAGTTVTLTTPAEVNGTRLAAGDYTVKLDGDHLTFFQGKKAVASAKATLEDRPTASPYDAVITGTRGDTKVVRGVVFRGKKQTVLINADSDSAAGN